jgi:hypothetical protein
MLSLGPGICCLACFAAAAKFQSFDRDVLSEYPFLTWPYADSSTMSKNSPVDAKREEFRKYLEKEGVLDSLTKALVSFSLPKLSSANPS